MQTLASEATRELQALGTNAVYILALMLCEAVALDQSRLADLTGWGWGRLRPALGRLEAHGLIARPNYRTWMVTPRAQQLALPLAGMKPLNQRFETSKTEVSNRPLEEEVEEALPKLISIPPLPPRAETSKLEVSSPQAVDNSAMLAAVGIEEPHRSRLAALPRVSPRYILEVATQALIDGMQPGGIVYRLGKGWDRTNDSPHDQQRYCPAAYDLLIDFDRRDHPEEYEPEEPNP